MQNWIRLRLIKRIKNSQQKEPSWLDCVHNSITKCGKTVQTMEHINWIRDCTRLRSVNRAMLRTTFFLVTRQTNFEFFILLKSKIQVQRTRNCWFVLSNLNKSFGSYLRQQTQPYPEENSTLSQCRTKKTCCTFR